MKIFIGHVKISISLGLKVWHISDTEVFLLFGNRSEQTSHGDLSSFVEICDADSISEWIVCKLGQEIADLTGSYSLHVTHYAFHNNSGLYLVGEKRIWSLYCSRNRPSAFRRAGHDRGFKNKECNWHYFAKRPVKVTVFSRIFDNKKNPRIT